jgi:hypothetical protein
MKKLLTIILSLAVCLAFVPAVSADSEDDAVAHIWAQVNTTVDVSVDQQLLIDGATEAVSNNAGQPGDFTAIIPFVVHSNVQDLAIYLEATHLYKANGNGELGPDAYHIPLNNHINPFINVINGGPRIGFTDRPNWVDGSAAAPINSLPVSFMTEPQEFQSEQGGVFSLDVPTTCVWTLTDSELPEGQYTGYVKMIAMLIGGGS